MKMKQKSPPENWEGYKATTKPFLREDQPNDRHYKLGKQL